MSVEQILLIVVAVGIAGTALKKIGEVTGYARLTNAGKAIEAVASNVPELIKSLIGILKPAKPVVSK